MWYDTAKNWDHRRYEAIGSLGIEESNRRNSHVKSVHIVRFGTLFGLIAAYR